MRKVKVVAINIMIFVAAWFAIESTCYILNTLEARKPDHISIGSPSWSYIFTRIFSNNQKVRSWRDRMKLDKGGGVKDSLGRRVSPQDPEEKDKAAVFIGGSYTFGSGVEAHETIPAHFHRQSDRRYRVYNYGIPGGGPHQFLYELQNEPHRFADIREKSKFFIVLFYDDHINRSTLQFSHILWSDLEMPAYHLQTNGGLSEGRHLANANPLKFLVFGLLKKSELVKYLIYNRSGNETAVFSEDDIRLTTQILLQMRVEILKLFPRSTVLFYSLFSDPSVEEKMRGLGLPLQRRTMPAFAKDDLLPDSHLSTVGNSKVAAELLRLVEHQ